MKYSYSFHRPLAIGSSSSFTTHLFVRLYLCTFVCTSLYGCTLGEAKCGSLERYGVWQWETSRHLRHNRETFVHFVRFRQDGTPRATCQSVAAVLGLQALGGQHEHSRLHCLLSSGFLRHHSDMVSTLVTACFAVK